MAEWERRRLLKIEELEAQHHDRGDSTLSRRVPSRSVRSPANGDGPPRAPARPLGPPRTSTPPWTPPSTRWREGGDQDPFVGNQRLVHTRRFGLQHVERG